MGDYVPAKLNFDEEERIVGMAHTKDYSETMLFFFDNGKVSKVPLSSYATKTNRKKLAKAYGTKAPLVTCFCQQEDQEYLMVSNNQRYLSCSILVIDSIQNDP